MISTNTKYRITTSLILIFLIFLMIKSILFLTYMLIIFGILSALEFNKITNKIFDKKLFKFILNFLFIFYISFFCFLFFFFSSFIQTKIILYIIIFGCIASDVGGFVVGRALKGPKITKISPNKTYAGFFGSLIFTILIVTLLIFLLNNIFSIYTLFISVIISISCQIGDLFFSYLKRKAKIKDTGSFLPGHGGILDRIDGILFSLPISFLSIILIY